VAGDLSAQGDELGFQPARAVCRECRERDESELAGKGDLGVGESLLAHGAQQNEQPATAVHGNWQIKRGLLRGEEMSWDLPPLLQSGAAAFSRNGAGGYLVKKGPARPSNVGQLARECRRALPALVGILQHHSLVERHDTADGLKNARMRIVIAFGSNSA
jgi:hypothetical protein